MDCLFPRWYRSVKSCHLGGYVDACSMKKTVSWSPAQRDPAFVASLFSFAIDMLMYIVGDGFLLTQDACMKMEERLTG